MERRTILAILLTLALLGALLPIATADSDEDEREDSRDRSEKSRDGKDRDDDEKGDKDRHGKPNFARSDKGHIFHNDQIAVYFKEGKNGKASPDIRVVVNGTDGNESGYRVKLLRLYESENGIEYRGSYNKMNLAKRDDWNVQTTEANDSLTLTMVRAESQGILTLTWHINTTSAEVKFDVGIQNWAWKTDATNHTIVLDMLIVGKNLRNETGARVSVGNAGYIAWETYADATYADGSTRTLNVTAHQKRSADNDDDEDDDGDDRGAHLLLAFEGAPGYTTLDYDPTFGLQSSNVKTTSVPGFTPVLIGLAAVAAVVLFGRRP